MPTDLANTTKALLAAELERLRTENTELAARPCLACAVTPDNHGSLVYALHEALLMLDRVDKSELAITPGWNDWLTFNEARRDLWQTFNRLTARQKQA